MLFYLVWLRKGKIVGIHNDFGRLSFIRSKDISSNYQCSQEEQVEIILDIISMLEGFETLF